MESAFLEVVAAYGYHEADARIFVQCFEADSLKRMRSELGSQLPMIQLIGDGNKYRDMTTEAGLKEIAGYAQGIGPAKGLLLDNPQLVQQAHHLGLQVHPYTLRDDDLPNGFASPAAELEAFFVKQGVDGAFTDFADTAVKFLAERGLRLR
jgi:glycerophosphoryl diester phosphodiesterase